MCEYCHLYTAIGKPCEVCKPVTVASKPKSRKREAGKPVGKKTTAAIKPLNPVTVKARLDAAGLTDTSMIVSGIQTGAVAGALYNGSSGNTEGVFLAYVAIVDSLVAEYPQVAKYRNRLVSGRAA